MKVEKIRELWISFFRNKGYDLIPSSPLVPVDDTSILWINSGVAAVKKYFSNPEISPSKNFVNCQRVIRTNDIDLIDNHSYHQTLFEMLGSFSVGGNFKQQIIPFIWEFFTSLNYLSLPPQSLFVTVLEEDLETLSIWKKETTIPHLNLVTGSRKTNFWDIGEGPCGPNTEIYFSLAGPVGKQLTIDQLDNKLFIEIINIVFSEFYHKSDQYLKLPYNCVDVGGGLERIAMVAQGVHNSFEIDLWKRPFDFLYSLSLSNNETVVNRQKWRIYVIIDHLRTLIFALCDGAQIQHKERGYILKKLLKKVSLFSYFLKIDNSSILQICQLIVESNSFYSKILERWGSYQLSSVFQNQLADFYSKFEDFKNYILRYLKTEKLTNKKIDSALIFFWYDTKGIPLEIIEFSLKKEDFWFSRIEFDQKLLEQKKRSLQDRKQSAHSSFSKNNQS